MERTFIASDPRTGKREAVIEVHPELLEGAGAPDLEQFERRLYEHRLHTGLLITPATAHFVQDSFRSLDFSPDSYEVTPLATSTLWSRVHGGVEHGEGLYLQARRWLEAVSQSWWTFVPDEALPMMLPAMVGALAQADIEEYRDVLDAA
jgi:hypothetical protein